MDIIYLTNGITFILEFILLGIILRKQFLKFMRLFIVALFAVEKKK